MRNLILGFVMATSSMLYELILAQILNLTLGGTIFQYTITIGLYATSLGVGSLLYQSTNETFFKNKIKMLYNIECLLGLIGILSILLTYVGLYYTLSWNIPLFIFQTFTYFLIFIIGLLSGLELPLLMDIVNNDSNSFEKNILFVDYLGTLAACVIFPLIMLPNLSLIAILFITVLGNFFVSLFFFSKKRQLYYSIILITTALIGLLYSSQITNCLSLNFTF